MYHLIITLQLLCSPAKDSIPFPYAIKSPSQPFAWKSIELNPPQRYRDSVIQVFKKIFTSYLNKDYLALPDFTSSIHFVALNNDRLPDVVYDGRTGGEGQMVNFFLNTGKKFQEKECQ